MARKKHTSTWFKHPLSVFFIGVFLLSLPLTFFVSQQNSPEREEVLAAAVDPLSGSPAPSGPTGAWHLIFSDEFNGTTLDLTKWIMCNPSFASSCNPYNGEKESYNTALTGNKNVKISGGQLHLIAIKDGSGDHPYSSGMVSTGPNKWNYNQPGYNGFQYTYGYYEGRVRVPKGNGFWPSLWMLPFDQEGKGGWPTSGEEDVFEIAGNDPTAVHMTEHDGVNGAAGDSAIFNTVDLSTDYHTFGFDWEPDHLAWYVDGKLARKMICTDVYAKDHANDCNEYHNAAAFKDYPFYIIANFSVGGTWPPLHGAPDASTPFPSSVDIDYLRVWQKGAGAAVPSASAPTSVPTSPYVSPTFAAINDCTVNGTCPSGTPTVVDTTPGTASVPTSADSIDLTPIVTDEPGDGGDDGNNGGGGHGDRQGLISLLLQLLSALLAFFAKLFGR